MSAEQRKPLAAFVMVFAAACLIMGQGLRTHVLDVLVSSGAPRQLIAAIAPDMVLGQALERKPRVRAQAPPTPPREPTTTVRTFDVVVAGGSQSSPQPVQVSTSGNRPRGSSTKPSGHKPRHAQGAKPTSVTPVSSPGAPVPAAVVPAVRTPKPAPATTKPVRGFTAPGLQSYTPTESTSRSQTRHHQSWSGAHTRSHLETVTRGDRGRHVRASGSGNGHHGRGADHHGQGADHHGGGDHHGHQGR